MFDQGLWTINDDLTVKVAHSQFAECNPHGRALVAFDGQPLLQPADPNLRPDPEHLLWHRQKRFLGR
jgi:predicted restriction endonuclease